ncbi:MAG: hypothetical protein C5B47_06495, partial [Verrucomicrobia bacterium]
MNNKRIWAIVGGIAGGIALLWLGYEWGRRQMPRFISPAPFVTGLQKLPKRPTSELFNGLTFQCSLVTPEGRDSAAV